MVYLQTLLATALTLSTSVIAGVVHPLPARQIESSNGNLIPIRDVEYVDENSTIIAVPSEPTILVPLRNMRQGNTKRDRKGALGLKSEASLYWGGKDGTAAKLTIEMPGDTENVLNMELFDDMVDKIHCPRNGTGRLKIRFNNETDFDSAEDIWKWVNEKPDNHFTLVIGAGDCGWNTDRLVYHVMNLIYNDERETAIFDVQKKTWKEAVHTFDLTVGKLAAESAKGQKFKRGFFDSIGDWFKDRADDVKDWFEDAADTVVDTVDSVINPDLNPDFTIPFSSDFSNKGLAFKMNGVEVGAHCLECRTTGAFDIEAKFRVRWGQMQEAWVQASTKSITAKAVIGLTLKGDLTGKLAEKSVPIFKISPAGVAIPGVLTIGPTVAINLGAEISQIKGGVSISFGGTAKIPPSTARLDFLSQAGTSSTGWKPSFEAAPFKADVLIEAKAKAYLAAAIGIEMSAIGV
jgi:hypothetical protein